MKGTTAIATLPTNHEYVDNVRPNRTPNDSTTVLDPNLSSHSFEHDLSKTACLSNTLDSSGHSRDTVHHENDTNDDPSLLPFDDDDNDENIAHRHTADSTILVDSDQVLTENHKVDIHNLSDFSLAPVRLMNTFEDTFSKSNRMDHTDVSNKHPPPIDGSPNGVEGIDAHTNNTTKIKVIDETHNKPTNHPSSNFTLDLPTFHLTDKLSLSLPQPTIDRISFYGVVYSVNHELHTLTQGDHRPAMEETTVPSNEDDSPLIHAVLDSNPTPPSPPSLPSPQGQMAILDEEEFLLAAIRSRTPEETSFVDCPTSFAEAIGEVESGDRTENAQTPNPLSVLAPSRTQLWKPSRSWWEAKSGKNPWIEPRSHNKRWRYLWPLIHYHKFLAKCIKKLKRNSIDVKTCTSPVSTFLRSEVCAVSNHLAASSRFTSEQWMEGLPEFHGWIPKDPVIEGKIRKLVVVLPLRSLGDPVDSKSPLLRDRIDQCFLLAMEADRGQMVADELAGGTGKEERLSNGGDVQYPVAGYGREQMGGIGSNGTATAVNRDVGYSRPPKAKPPKKVQGSATKQRRSKKKVDGINGRYPNNPMSTWNRQGHQMMPSHSHLQHGMYPPPYNNHYTVQHPPHNNYPSGNGYSFGNGVGAPPNMYGGTEDYTHHLPQAEWGSHPMNPNMHYYNRWEQPHMANEIQYFQQAPNGSVGSWIQPEDASVSQTQYSEQLPPTYNPIDLQTNTSENHTVPEEVSPGNVSANSTTAELPQKENLQTPSKPRHNTNERSNPNPSIQPDSPYWAHLGFSTLAMSGLATPQGNVQRAASPLTRLPNGEVGAAGEEKGAAVNVHASKLLLNASFSYHHQCNAMNVPPSPATQFLMSPQINSRATAFFAQAQMNPTFASPSPHPHHPHQTSEHQQPMAIQQQTRLPDPPESVERVEKGAKHGKDRKVSEDTEEKGGE